MVHEVLRVPNFVVSSGGETMSPTLPCVSVVYFQWFLEECERRGGVMANSTAAQLDILASNATGGERGNAFE